MTDDRDVIYDGFRQALGHAVPVGSAGILIDDDNADLLRDAGRRGYVTALTVDAAGSAAIECGTEVARSHIAPFKPTFATALVRYDPEGDPAANRRQAARLAELSDRCRVVRQRLILELVVPCTAEQPDRTLHSIRALHDAGVEPDVWTIQGFDRRIDCQRVIATVRRAGRTDVCCVVRAHDTDHDRTSGWLETAASVPGFHGFTVGRLAYGRAVAAYAARQVTRREAVSLVARRYREWVTVFERARGNHVRTA